MQNTNAQRAADLRIEMEKALEAAFRVNIPQGTFKQSQWYQDRKAQLIAWEK